jgi:hypothetical protein
MRRFLAMLPLLLMATAASAQHQHGGAQPESFTATPTFGPDGTLWLARGAKDRVVVVRSSDLGKTFSDAVPVTPGPINIDWGPDARPRIVVDAVGRPIVTYAIFQDQRFNGRAFYTRSTDNGASFAAPQPLTADSTSQRFETVAIDPGGKVFSAWLDKRNVATKKYAGAALAFAWSDDGSRFGDTTIAVDNTCECCRLAVAFAGPGRPAVLFRNIFPGSIRDHALLTFKANGTPGPLRRVSVDNWQIEACPHHGPSLAISADGGYHAAWFTGGTARQGLFYARADNEDAAFGEPRALSSPGRQPARPYLLAVGSDVHLVWKEFDGTRAQVRWQVSHDNGRSWTAVRTVAETTDASDHPLLVSDKKRTYLSWLTKQKGYRLIPLEDTP